MKSHRSELVLSHFLPLLILLPLLAVLLVYIIETQVILADLSVDLAHEADTLAQIASQQQAVFIDDGQAEFFEQAAGAQYEHEVALYQADGAELGLPVPQGAQVVIAPTQTELLQLRLGVTQVRTQTSVNPANANAEVLTPVFDARKQLIGVVRVSEHIARLNGRLTQMRLLILGATAAALLVALAVSAYFASRTARRLSAVTDSIANVARGVPSQSNDAAMLASMPVEFRATFDAVGDLQKRLRESEETRKRLLANLVHELGRPLGALQAAIHALQQGADKDVVLRDELLQGMDSQVERLKPLLDNLASLHGGLSGALELHRAPVNVGQWLPKSIVTWREAAEQKKLGWREDIPNDLPAVNLDADRMAQVIGNLLSNAIKYTPEAGGEITVSAQTWQRGVEIVVSDTGIGISPQDLPNIFDPFFRGNNAAASNTNRFPQGLGLGLAIARDIVNAHEGRIEVTSEGGRGSQFRVYLQ